MGVMESERGLRAALLWRCVVILGSAAAAVAVAAGMAQGLPGADDPLPSALRGGAVALSSGVTLFGTAWLVRRGFVLSGLPADEPLVPASFPEPVQRLRERLAGSRAAAVLAGALIGVLIGVLGASVDVDAGRDDARVAASEAVQLGSSFRDGDSRTSGSKAAVRGGDEDETFEDSTDGSDPGNGDSASGSDDSGATAGSGGSGESGGSGGGTSGPTTTTTTSPLDFVCDALDDYQGDIDALLDSLGLDEDELTPAACDDIEAAIETLNDLLGDILPVPTTLPSLPVTTTPITLPSLPVPTTLPLLPVPTTITLPPLL